MEDILHWRFSFCVPPLPRVRPLDVTYRVYFAALMILLFPACCHPCLCTPDTQRIRIGYWGGVTNSDIGGCKRWHPEHKGDARLDGLVCDEELGNRPHPPRTHAPATIQSFLTF